jgi:hypothetical protein
MFLFIRHGQLLFLLANVSYFVVLEKVRITRGFRTTFRIYVPEYCGHE